MFNTIFMNVMIVVILMVEIVYTDKTNRFT